MNFLYSQYLYFVPLVIAPLIIYLIFRKKPKKMIFSSLYILKELALKINKKTRLKDIILLIIRTLIVLCIIMFFAAPYLGNKSDFDPELDTSIYIYFDTSTSMAESDDNFSAMDISLSSLRNLLKDIPERYEIVIKTTDPEKKFTGSKKDAALFLNDISVSGMQRDIFEVIAEADSFYLSEEIESNKEFFIFSDGKLSTNKENLNFTSEFNKYFIKTELDISNRNDISIDSVKINNKNQVACYVSSNKTGKNISTNLELYESGNKIYSENIIFEDIAKKTVIIDHTNITIDDTPMFFKVGNDINSMNNTYYFIMPGTSKIKTLIIGNEDGSIVISLRVLMNTATDSLFTSSAIDFNSINSVTLTDFDVLLFSDIKKLGSYTVSQLKTHLKSGKSVIFVYGKDLNLNDYNANAIPGLNLPAIKGVEKFSDSYQSIKISNREHPVFSGVFVKDFDPGSLEIYSYYRLDPTGCDVIAEVDRHPYLLEKNIAYGKVILISSGFEPESSNIIENGFIVPLIQNSLKYLDRNLLSSKINYYCGDKIVLSKGAKAFNQKSAKIINSAYQDQNITLSNQGIYTIKNNDGVVRSVAVNNIREKNKETDKEYLNNFDIISSEDLAKNNIFSVERNNYSFIFLYALVLLIAAEIILARKL